LGHHRTDHAHEGEFLGGRLGEPLQGAEVLGESGRDGGPNVANTEGVDDPTQRSPLRGLDGRQEVGRGLVAHAFEGGELAVLKAVEIGDAAYEALLHELLDDGRTQAIDVHAAAGGPVLERALELGPARGTLAAVDDLALLPGDLAAAGRALRGHDEGPLLAGAPVCEDLDHLGDDVPRLLDHHAVADADALALHLIHVVEARAADRGPIQEHGLHDGDRCHGSGAADGGDDVIDGGLPALRLELVGDRPAGAARDGPQPALLLDGVDLEDEAIHVVGQAVAFTVQVFEQRVHLGHPSDDPVGGRWPEAHLAQEFQ